MYRISRNGQEPIIDVDQVEAIEPAIRSSEPGRYHVDEISADPLPSGHTSSGGGSGSSGRMVRWGSSRTRGRNLSRPQILSSPAPSFDGFDVHRLEGRFFMRLLATPLPLRQTGYHSGNGARRISRCSAWARRRCHLQSPILVDR